MRRRIKKQRFIRGSVALLKPEVENAAGNIRP
jgi:hypothetical protein